MVGMYSTNPQIRMKYAANDATLDELKALIHDEHKWVREASARRLSLDEVLEIMETQDLLNHPCEGVRVALALKNCPEFDKVLYKDSFWHVRVTIARHRDPEVITYYAKNEKNKKVIEPVFVHGTDEDLKIILDRDRPNLLDAMITYRRGILIPFMMEHGSELAKKKCRENRWFKKRMSEERVR